MLCEQLVLFAPPGQSTADEPAVEMLDRAVDEPEADHGRGPFPPSRGRVRGLDVARGVAVGGMVLVENLPGDGYPWLRHAAWDGWTGADLVFPMFLVVLGAGLAFALDRPHPLGRQVRRAVALVVLGLVFNAWAGAGADLAALRIPGVLQRIAVCGLAGAVVVVALRRRPGLVLATAGVVLLVYGLVLGDTGSTLGGRIDEAVFGADHLYRGGAAGYDPEGLLSSLGGLASVLVGYVGGSWLRDGAWARVAGLAAASLVLSGVLPGPAVNKRLWTPSFVLFTAWVALGVLVLAHLLVDRHWPGRTVAGALTQPLQVLGRNALVVYVGQHFVGVALLQTFIGDVPVAVWIQQHVAAGLAYALLAVAAWYLVALALHLAHWYVRL